MMFCEAFKTDNVRTHRDRIREVIEAQPRTEGASRAGAQTCDRPSGHSYEGLFHPLIRNCAAKGSGEGRAQCANETAFEKSPSNVIEFSGTKKVPRVDGK